ncbi:uncharacterized protein LOC124279618 [Haliotis rubra]|uniref:uncharacterized protein LOC124279618 n=1 Tax=Haliotis rubra TaxID=36100 RepID=UPI001EE5AF1B|nr:uncharacterized protein LOC124279618 [Haliotis rubra]
MSNLTPDTPACNWESVVLGRDNRSGATPDLGASGNSGSPLSTRCSLTSRKLQFESGCTNGNTAGTPRISTEPWRDTQEFSPPFQNTTNTHFVLPSGHQQSPPLQPLQTRAHGSGYPSSCSRAPFQNEYTGLRKYDMSEHKSGNGLNNETHCKQAMSRCLEASGPSNINDINRCIVYSAQSKDLTPISNMLKSCQVFHPLDAVPKTPRSSPVKGPVRSLMDGGDALDVRGLASRLSKMQSESSMRDALQEYIHTHVPSVEGAVDSLIEDTVQQIATVSLRDRNPRRCVSGITATRDWLKLQNGCGVGASPSRSNNHGKPQPTSPHWVHSKSLSPNQKNLMSPNHHQTALSSSVPNQSGLGSGNQNWQITQSYPNGSRVYVNLPSTSSSRDDFNRRQVCQILGVSSSEMVELDSMSLHRRNEYTLPGCNDDNQKVTEVYDISGEVLYTDYVSPEERRYEHYLSKTCHRSKRKFQDVDNMDGHWGKRKMSFVREELTDSRLIRFNNGSWN